MKKNESLQRETEQKGKFIQANTLIKSNTAHHTSYATTLEKSKKSEVDQQHLNNMCNAYYV